MIYFLNVQTKTQIALLENTNSFIRSQSDSHEIVLEQYKKICSNSF